MKKRTANVKYKIGKIGDFPYIMIIDKDKGKKSVTNDIENVVADIAEYENIDGQSLLDYTIVYKDSMGLWTGWEQATKSFFPVTQTAMEREYKELKK